ncbi:MAG: class I SAM-dependent methyltransferase [Planctomycetaceae bacterium]|nr:class I SAM-dependent methyltransferase [Planctomycetaceae bacterium]
MSISANIDRDWENRYVDGDTPWDSGLRSAELASVLDEFDIPRRRALELGCGSGTNAVYLAQQGFDVTAVDCSETALSMARRKAAAIGVTVNWITADVQNFGAGHEPFDFVFDRGCYHCCRRVDLNGYLETHRQLTQPGTWTLILAGNPNDGTEGGPPKAPPADMLSEFDPLYRLIRLREMHFQDPGGVRGPLGWSCLMQRR